MRVLIINLRIGTGSVGRIVSDLYHGTIQKGHECKIAYARGGTGDVPVEDTYKICTENEVKIHAGLTRLFGNTAFYFSRTTSRFCEWIEQYNPDIVHLHGVYGYYLNMETLFTFLSQKKCIVISTLHSCWDFTGHCCYFDYTHCDKWKTGCIKCNQKHSYPKSSFLDNTSRNYTRKKKLYDSIDKCIIVTPSKWLANYVEQSFLSGKKTVVINNGIDLKSFSYKEETPECIAKDIPTILCVANIWEQRKGWEDIVQLSKQASKNIQLVVVGVKESQKKELASGTICISRTNSKDDLAMLYSHSTVFFNPTYEDNYPTVNLEAAACNLPIVTYETGGSPEIFQLGNWGTVIQKKDFEALLDYTNKVFNKQIIPDFTNKDQLSKDIMVMKYMELYGNCIESMKQG